MKYFEITPRTVLDFAFELHEGRLGQKEKEDDYCPYCKVNLYIRLKDANNLKMEDNENGEKSLILLIPCCGKIAVF